MSKHLFSGHTARLAVPSLLAGLYATTGLAGPLNLSDNALEVVVGVEPNIMIVNDDSGSMDWEVMSTDYDHGGLFTGTQPDGSSPAGSGTVKHRDSDDDGIADCGFNSGTFHGYLYIVEFGSNTYGDNAQDCNTADDEAWRIRNSDFNPMYFDPNKVYLPWEGVDINGNPYGDIDITNAPDNPYDPQEFIDLTRHNSNWGGGTTRFESDRDGDGQPDGFRYYTWQDLDGDGLFDDGEETEHKIRDKNPAIQQNFANWFSYYRKRDLTAKAAFSAAVKPAETARIGYATINNNANNRIRVASMNVSPASGNKRALLDELFQTRPNNGTPLRRALRDTGRYFDCAAGDIFDSGSASSPGSSNCPVLSSSDGGQCQQNYTILMTDGFWNGGTPGVGNTDNGSGDFDGGAYADGFSNTLADVAMHYYETDLHSLANEVPTTLRDISGYLGTTSPFETMHQHMATYTVGFGVTGSITADPTDPALPFNWPDAAATNAGKIDDLRHAAYNGRGQFLSANDPVGLATAMKDIFTDIAKSTGTATAVAFNTQEVGLGSLVFRASFNTKTNKGDLVAHALRTDPVTKKIEVDPAITWSAAQQLDAKTASSSDTRTIITYKDTGTNTSEGIPFRWNNLTSGSGSQQEALNDPQPANVSASTNTFGDERLGYLRGHSVDEGDSAADGEFRERSAIAGKLGDIVHSTPVFVGKPRSYGRYGGAYPQTPGTTYAEFMTAYENRQQLAYVGANDGMLHAFDTNTGSELFAYVPGTMFSKLSNLTDPDYTHEFFVDLTVSVNDVFMTPTTGGTNSGSLSWNTLLIGGLGAGGKGYYALNVTDPADLDTENEARHNVLWEFTEADDGGIGSSDLGFTFSQPLIDMSNVTDGSGNQKWIAVFGNGYNSTSADGDATLYVLFIEGGQDGVWTIDSDYIKISTGNGKAESADGSTPNGIGGVRGVDIDGNGTLDYVYAGDLQGNLYRFDLTGTSLSSWKNTPKTIFQARYDPLGSKDIQPITTKPIVVPHPTDSGLIVIAATGSWMTTDDATSTDIQSIYGIWDDLSSNPLVTVESGTNQLVEQVFINEIDKEHGYTVRTLTNNPINWNNTGSPANKVKGWYIDLDMPAANTSSPVEYPGERAVRNLQVRGSLLFVNTIIPRPTNACSIGAGGYELGFNPYTGGSGSKVIFDLNGDQNFSELDNADDTAGDANIVTGIRFDAGTPTDSAFIGNQRMTQADDDIRSFGTNTDGNEGIGRTSWREIIN